ncbi:MAG TPA: hypothetical protein VL728_06675 [Cyclobacteriaceae bacterium]|jgi:hypothetical protein|nr:hypothetical protein [Cyclobacteriaceae bacterium]
MKPDSKYDALPWGEAFARIIEERDDLEPVLVVRDDDFGKLSVLRDCFRSRLDTFEVRLGLCSNTNCIGIEVLLHVDPNYGRERLTKKSIPQETVMIRLRKKIPKLPFTPIIVIDNCHYLDLRLLFKVARMVNELDGKAMFVFLIPGDFFSKWNQAVSKNPRLNIFLKLLKHRYEIN